MDVNNLYHPMQFYKYETIYDDTPYPLDCFGIAKGRYYIYTDGRIYSIVAKRFLKPFINQAGYLRIGLMLEDGSYKNFSIHRLVAETFIVNIYGFSDVDHVFGNKLDNYYTHLQWCNNPQNKHYASINGQYQHGENRYNSVYSDEFAMEICQQFQDGIPYIDVYKKYCKTKEERSKLGSLIYKLYHRQTRREITDQYTY